MKFDNQTFVQFRNDLVMKRYCAVNDIIFTAQVTSLIRKKRIESMILRNGEIL